MEDVSAGIDVLRRFADATWWSWEDGSTLVFWRWPEGDQRRYARDGMEAYITAKLPQNNCPPRPPKAEKRPYILDKIIKILKRGYVTIPDMPFFIRSLIDYFDIPKGLNIRILYNGTSCGLNDALWAPHFWLPTPALAGRVLGFGYYMVDIDLGKMFLNFPLPSVLKRYSGVDVTAFNLKEAPAWGHWTRCWMGLKPSPYMSVRFYYLAEEFASRN
jgi:hypothetical protein